MSHSMLTTYRNLCIISAYQRSRCWPQNLNGAGVGFAADDVMDNQMAETVLMQQEEVRSFLFHGYINAADVS